MSFPPDFFARRLRHTPRKPWKPLQQLLKACRWLVDRLARPVVIGSLVVGCWALFVAYQILTIYRPPIAGALLVWAFGFACGLAWRDRRRKALAVVSDWHDEEIGAIKLADTLADKGEMSGEHLVDGEAIEPPFNWAECPMGHHTGDALPCTCGSPCHLCGNPSVGWVSREGDKVPLCADCWPAFWEAVQSPVLGYSGSSGGIPVQYIQPEAWTPAKTAQLLALNTERAFRLRARDLQQVTTEGRSASSTGPAWVTCGRCAGRGWFDAVPAQGLRWMQCPECSGTGGQWGQP